MAKYDRRLRAFVRFDGSGRVIPSSVVLRKSKPRVGRWQEIVGYECCEDVTVSFVLADPNLTNATLTLTCNGTTIASPMETGVDTTSDAEVLTALNTAFSAFGTFANPSATNFTLTVSQEQKRALCPQGTLGFSVASA